MQERDLDVVFVQSPTVINSDRQELDCVAALAIDGNGANHPNE
jgi:hypothetical protein